VLAAGSTVCDPFFNAVLLCDDDDALWPKTLHCNASQLIQGVFCCSAADALLMYCLRTAVCACVYAESKEVFALDPIRMRELVLQGPDITWLVSRGGRGGGAGCGGQGWVASRADVSLTSDVHACRAPGRVCLCLHVLRACILAWPRFGATAAGATVHKLCRYL
jgi:hypothetical protein